MSDYRIGSYVVAISTKLSNSGGRNLPRGSRGIVVRFAADYMDVNGRSVYGPWWVVQFDGLLVNCSVNAIRQVESDDSRQVTTWEGVHAATGYRPPVTLTVGKKVVW